MEISEQDVQNPLMFNPHETDEQELENRNE